MSLTDNKLNINCDLGEGIDNDHLIMPLISSCNIACGGHYGSHESIRKAIYLAKNNDVLIGAHPSFPDKENFGRSVISISEESLKKSIQDQVYLFLRVCAEEGIKMHHIKLHGALYNLAAKDLKTAWIVLNALIELNVPFKIYAPYKSVIAEIAHPYFPVVYEAFIDRTYQKNLNLTPRTSPGALISDPNEAWEQLQGFMTKQAVKAVTGDIINIKANTYCIHGDNPNIIKILEYINERLI